MHEVKKSLFIIIIITLFTISFYAEDKSHKETSEDRPNHRESAAQDDDSPEGDMETPPLPENMTLEEVLEYSNNPPPENFPDPVPDDQLYVFTLFEKMEYRFANQAGHDHLGWEAQGWIGYDYNKFWWKNEGENVFEDEDEGESEIDLLYSRLITSFWNFQIGAQFANEWSGNEYGDRWSGVIAIQGMAPYKFEVDNSLYVTEDGDVINEFEAEYDLRITQRLVLQPLFAMSISAQDIKEKGIGAGITDGKIDFRLRYEFKREFAPYIGFRYQQLLGKTENIAESSGSDTEQSFIMAGLRFAF